MFHVTQMQRLDLGSHRVVAQGFARYENFCNISKKLHQNRQLSALNSNFYNGELKFSISTPSQRVLTFGLRQLGVMV